MNLTGHRHFIRTLVLGSALVPGALWAQRSDLIAPAKRAAVVEQARAFVTISEGEALPETLNNPFSPNAFSRAGIPAPAANPAAPVELRGPSSDQDLLELIAPSITPSGTMIVGGQSLLLFGQKKVKEGDALPITFQDVPYVLFITRIQPASFTLRLNDAQLTRPIKSGN